MSTQEWSADVLVSGAAVAAADALASLLGRAPGCVVLFQEVGPPLDPISPGCLPRAVTHALAHGAPGVAAGLRGATEPVVIRSGAVARSAPELHAALRARGFDALVAFPLAGDDAASGSVLFPYLPGEALPDEVTGWRIPGQTFRGIQLAAAAAALRALFGLRERSGAASIDGATVLDAESRIVLTHGLSRRAAGWGRADFGRPVSSLAGGDLLRSLPGCALDGIRWEEHLFPPIAGRSTPVALAAIPLGPPDGLAAGSRLILAHDLRAIPTASVATKPDAARLLALRAKVMLHELERVLAEERGSAGEVGYLTEVARSATRACHAVERQPHAVGIDVNHLLDEAIERHREQLAEQRVRVFSFLRRPIPPARAGLQALVHIPDAMLQCARASLGNGEGTLTLRSWSEGGLLCLAASDTGNGAPDAFPGGTLEPLGPRSSEAERAPPEAIDRLRRLAHAAGGYLDIDRRPGVWNRYTVLLPAALETERAAAEAPGVSPHPGRPDRALGILVVDDNAALRSVMRRYLERRGHEVTEAVNGEEAMKLVEGRSFDRLLVDVHMPGTDGPTFFLFLARLDPELQQRTIFMTGGNTDSETASLILLTGRRPLYKPFQLVEAALAIEEG